MKVVIDIPEDRYADIQRIASVQLERRCPTPEQIIAKGVNINEPRTGKWINHLDDDGHHIADCSECGHAIQWFDDEDEPKYCCLCGSYNGGQE